VEFSDLRLSSSRETGEYINDVLKAGITVNGHIYNFFGHSNSQLKSRSCYMYEATPEEIEKIINRFVLVSLLPMARDG